MTKSRALRSQELRAILALVNDCRDFGDDFDGWCEHYTAGLARLTGAAFGMGGILAHGQAGIEHRAGTAWGWENGFDPRLFAQVMAEHGGGIQIRVVALTSKHCE